MFCGSKWLILQNNDNSMEQNNTKFYKNRGMRRFYIAMPIITVVWIVLFGFIAPSISTIISFFTIFLFMGVFSVVKKYAITPENTIEFYSYFGRRKKLSVPIDCITKISSKGHRLSLDYEKEGGFSPSYGVLELSDTDMIEVKNELLERNPKIEIS